MTSLFFSLISATIVSLVSLIGIFSFAIKNKDTLNKIIFFLVGLSAGVLIGSAFFHLIPESLETSQNNEYIFLYLVAGFMIFFILERIILWRHCHKDVCDVHPFGTLNLIGDAIHNFIDGIIIFTGFSHSVESGIIVSFAVLLHEIPQELGDFGILIYSGYKIPQALFFNLLSAATCIFGVIFSFFVFSPIKNFSVILMPLAAGGFLYIASCDLIPELHRHKDRRKSNLAFLMFIFGLILMLSLKKLHIH